MEEVPDGYEEVKRRYEVPDGRLLVVRDRVDVAVDDERYLIASRVLNPDGHEVALVSGDTRDATIAKMFEPWATVLLVGNPRRTEYGVTIKPPKGLVEGARILMSPTGGRDVKLKSGDMEMDVTVIPFETVMLIDKGEQVGDVQ